MLCLRCSDGNDGGRGRDKMTRPQVESWARGGGTPRGMRRTKPQTEFGFGGGGVGWLGTRNVQGTVVFCFRCSGGNYCGGRKRDVDEAAGRVLEESGTWWGYTTGGEEDEAVDLVWCLGGRGACRAELAGDCCAML